jgi:eukaryotic translation initiation factor 2C
MMVDLDAEQGRRPGKAPNTFKMTVRKTGRVDTAVLQAYFQGRIQFNDQILVAISEYSVHPYNNLFY